MELIILPIKLRSLFLYRLFFKGIKETPNEVSFIKFLSIKTVLRSKWSRKIPYECK